MRAQEGRKGKFRARHLVMSLVLVAVAGVVLTGSSFGGTSRSKVVTVTYGHVPFAGDAVIVLAKQQGFFKKVGLDVNIENAASINGIVPAVVGGTYQFGLQSGGGTAVAISQGIPVAIVANAYFHRAEQMLMVKTGGPIKGIQDLKGKTVDLGALNNNYQAGLFYLLEGAGVKPSQVKFETTNTSQIATLVEKGQVAAGQINEPFITAAGDKLTPLMDPLQVFGMNAANAYVIVNPHWADSHKSTVRKFLTAYNAAQRFAADPKNRAIVAKTIASYTNIDLSIIKKMNMPGFGPDLHMESQLEQQQFMYRYHFLKKPVTLKQIFYQGLNIEALAHP